MQDNSPETIAATLKRVTAERLYEHGAPKAAQDAYGSQTVSRSLDGFLKQVTQGVVTKRKEVA